MIIYSMLYIQNYPRNDNLIKNGGIKEQKR
jgi:hypothetical protein